VKLLHLADLHIGKRVNEFSMLEDQRYILEQIIKIVLEENTDGVLIAGDIYDKSMPSAEAVELLDSFLTELNKVGQAVFMISGNHDSPERIGFGSRIMEKNNLYITGVYDGKPGRVALTDEHGTLNIYMLPFIKPAMIRPYHETAPESYEEAVKLVLSDYPLVAEERNILLAHQFVINGLQEPERSDSENISVGGVDQVDISVFDKFDYVALGHLHRAQKVGRDTIRYAGSPLKYSFSEARYVKSVYLLECGAKGDINIQAKPLYPLHDLREIKGPMKELLLIGKEATEGAEDYMHVTLTDEEEIYDAIGQLRQVYPNLMLLDFENSRSGQAVHSFTAASLEGTRKNPVELFDEFYQIQNNTELSFEQKEILADIMGEVIN